jgi:glycosyltransferase involved in cell wall biosynthesis
VLDQDYPNLELLVVDNASNDGTAAVAQKFAEADPRIRYVRNSANIGFLPNFRKALDLSTGRYFTWLAHDDELSDPAYLSTAVAYLQEHPDVVCCHTAFWLLDNELPGSRQRMSFPELDPQRRWPAARRALFRWPHGWLDSVIYGVFRRDEMAKIPFPEWTYKDEPHIFCWEMDVLTRLTGAGRIVALPDCLRSYRLSSVSVGKQMGETVSSYDLLILGLRMKLTLLRRAFSIPAGRMERLLLLATAFGNLFRANFRQPYDHRTVLHQRERELKLLQETAAERAKLIKFLKDEIEARRQIVVSRGLASQSAGRSTLEGAEEPEVPRNPMTPASRRSPAGRLAGFFRPLDENEVRRFYELGQQIGVVRGICERQASAIERLTSEAERWLTMMHSGR